MSIKGVIFDLDGTLLNTITDLNNSINETYKELGLDKRNSEEETMKKVGNGIRKLVERCYPDKDDEFLDLALKTFMRKYDEKYNEFSKPFDGIVELIEELQRRNIKIGVNSNKYDEYTKKLIKENFKDINLNYVFGGMSGYGVKPDPALANLIIANMGLNKDEVIYVGDTGVDYQTGKNAGIKVINVSWGFRSIDELKEAGAEIIIHKASDLLRYL